MKKIKIIEVGHYYKDREKHVPKGYRLASCGELLDEHLKDPFPEGWYSCSKGAFYPDRIVTSRFYVNYRDADNPDYLLRGVAVVKK